MNETELLQALQERYRNGEIDYQQYELEKADIQKQSTLFSDFESSLNKTSNTPELTTIFDSPAFGQDGNNTDFLKNMTSVWDNPNYDGGVPDPERLNRDQSVKHVNSGIFVDPNKLASPPKPLDLGIEGVNTGLEPQDNITYHSPGYVAPKAPQVDIEELHITQSRNKETLSKNQPKEASDVMSMADKYLPFLNPYGTDISTELFSLGRFAGMEKGTQGRGLGIASSALSAGLGGARTFMSGLAQSKQMSRVEEDMRKQLEEKKYTKNAQYLNQNSRGGVTSN